MRSCCGTGSVKNRSLTFAARKRGAYRAANVRERLLRVLIGLLVAAAVCPAQDYVDRVVERARKEFDVPGIAVAIVNDGNVILAKGYGVRKLGEPAPVTARSLFRIASNTKAFTAAALAMLVDEGKLRWDDAVKGEMTVLVGRASAPAPDDTPVDEAVDALMRAGTPRMDAIKQVARRRGMSKREVYEKLLRDK